MESNKKEKFIILHSQAAQQHPYAWQVQVVSILFYFLLLWWLNGGYEIQLFKFTLHAPGWIFLYEGSGSKRMFSKGDGRWDDDDDFISTHRRVKVNVLRLSTMQENSIDACAIPSRKAPLCALNIKYHICASLVHRHKRGWKSRMLFSVKHTEDGVCACSTISYIVCRFTLNSYWYFQTELWRMEYLQWLAKMYLYCILVILRYVTVRGRHHSCQLVFHKNLISNVFACCPRDDDDADGTAPEWNLRVFTPLRHAAAC